MRRSYLIVLALAAIAAVAVAVPAFGQGDSLVTQALELATGADRKAESADRKAEAARRRAARAQRRAARAQRVARQAKRLARRKAERGPRGLTGATGPAGPAGAAGAAGPPGTPPAILSGAEAAEVETTATDYQDLGGPAVELTVPPSGLVEVYAQVSMRSPAVDADDAGAVGLFDGDTLAAGQDPICGQFGGPPGLPAALLAAAPVQFEPSGEPVAIGTGTTPQLVLGCGTLGPPTPLLLRLSPGPHTLSLRYAYCGCSATSGPIAFSDRQLYVTPRP